MHQRTYKRLLERLLGCEEERDGAIAAFLGRLMELTCPVSPVH